MEVWLIGRDDDFIGQILMVLKVKKQRKKRRCSVKQIADEQGCEKKHKKWSEELISGTEKLMAISPRGG